MNKSIQYLFCIISIIVNIDIVAYADSVLYNNETVTGIWVNDGLDKVTKDELRVSSGDIVTNSVWNGSKIKLFGARNEVIAFNLIIESAYADSTDISLSISELQGPNGHVIRSKPVSKSDVFNYVGRDIEIFLVEYLPIRGLSRLAYSPDYDERHVPLKLQLPYTLPKGKSTGEFSNRPNANKFYPDIAIPIEAIKTFTISKGCNQSIWVDIYIPRNSTPGQYLGMFRIINQIKT